MLNHRAYHIQQPTNPCSAQRGLYAYTKVYTKQTYLPRKMTSLLLTSSTTFVYPLTFFVQKLCRPRNSVQTNRSLYAGGLNNRSSSQREGELQAAPCHQALFRCEQVLRVSESSTTHKRYSWYASPELLSSLFPAMLCEDQTAPTSFSGERKPDRLFMRLSMFSVSAFPSTLNLHMCFVLLSALERRE